MDDFSRKGFNKEPKVMTETETDRGRQRQTEADRDRQIQTDTETDRRADGQITQRQTEKHI